MYDLSFSPLCDCDLSAPCYRSMDLDAILSEESWCGGEKVRARYLSVPGWREATVLVLGVMETVQLTFSLPLESRKLTNKLRGRAFVYL